MSLSYNRPEASTMRCSEQTPRSRLLLPADPPRMQVPENILEVDKLVSWVQG